MGAPSQQRFFWEEKWTELRILPNKGNNNYWLIHFERLFTSQTMQWILRSDGEHSVALASDFLKISNCHPRLVLWLILKHLESKERRLNLNCPCPGTGLSVNSSLEMVWVFALKTLISVILAIYQTFPPGSLKFPKGWFSAPGICEFQFQFLVPPALRRA